MRRSRSAWPSTFSSSATAGRAAAAGTSSTWPSPPSAARASRRSPPRTSAKRAGRPGADAARGALHEADATPRAVSFAPADSTRDVGRTSTKWTRRQVLKGAGVALSVPWLETFETKKAQAQTAPVRRYMSVYWPNGTADGYLWGATGAGASMTLAPILQPLQPNISKVMPLGGVGNYSPWNGHVEPSHGNNCATAWTGVKAERPDERQQLHLDRPGHREPDRGLERRQARRRRCTSLQVGLSTLDSYTDGLPGPHSRSISWKDAASPLYKIVSPQTVFDAWSRAACRRPATRRADGARPGGRAARGAQEERARLHHRQRDEPADAAQQVRQRPARPVPHVGARPRDARRRRRPSVTQAGLDCSPLARPTQTVAVNQPYAARLQPRHARDAHDRPHRHGLPVRPHARRQLHARRRAQRLRLQLPHDADVLDDGLDARHGRGRRLPRPAARRRQERRLRHDHVVEHDAASTS